MKKCKKYLITVMAFTLILLSSNIINVYASDNSLILPRANMCCDSPSKTTIITPHRQYGSVACWDSPQICSMRENISHKIVKCRNCGAVYSTEIYDFYYTHSNPNHAGW